MPRKRRKLSRALELEISKARQKVELITAQINDIQEDDIQSEYRSAFDPIRNTYLLLNSLYTSEGLTSQTEQLIKDNKNLLATFESEYEI